MGETAGQTVVLRVYGYSYPVRNPQADELVTCDNNGSVALVAELLRRSRFVSDR